MQHAEFRTPFATAAVAPIVEMLTLYFPSEIDQENVDATLLNFIQTIADNSKGFVGRTTGWVVEELEHDKVDGKAKAYAVAIGWESLEAHIAYRETQTFKDEIVKVRAIAKGSVVVSPNAAVEMVPIWLMQPSITSSSQKLEFHQNCPFMRTKIGQVLSSIYDM